MLCLDLKSMSSNDIINLLKKIYTHRYTFINMHILCLSMLCVIKLFKKQEND